MAFFRVYFSEEEYYDSGACTLYLKGKPIDISGYPKKIFDFLIEHRCLAMSRGQIASDIYGSNEVDYTNTNDDRRIDNHVKELRRKLDNHKRCIQTVQKIGYKYVGPDMEKYADPQLETNPPVQEKETTAHPAGKTIFSQLYVDAFDATVKGIVEATDLSQIKKNIQKLQELNESFISTINTLYAKNIPPNNYYNEEFITNAIADGEDLMRQIFSRYRRELKISDEMYNIKSAVPEASIAHFLFHAIALQINLEDIAISLLEETINKEEYQRRKTILNDIKQIQETRVDNANDILNNAIATADEYEQNNTDSRKL